MTEPYNNLIISRISTLIPPHIKLVDFLMDTLDIGRESAYRRIRNQVPFTLEEAAILSSNLNFSIDDIFSIDKSHNTVLARTLTNPNQTAEDLIHKMLEVFYNQIVEGGQSGDLEITIANNRLLFYYFFRFPNLFRFFYFKCCRQNNDISLNSTFFEVATPLSITNLVNQISQNMHHIKKETFIIDENVYLAIMREIQYAYLRKLITDDEFITLKGEFGNFLNYVEILSQVGDDQGCCETNFYLSMLNIEGNQLFVEYDDKTISTYFVSTFIPLYITDPNVCKIQKKWLEAQKIHSVLITKSNEFHQVDFFRKQYQYLEKLGNELI
jgi:hypothetical protein